MAPDAIGRSGMKNPAGLLRRDLSQSLLFDAAIFRSGS
jgi:hypothetical protein